MRLEAAGVAFRYREGTPEVLRRIDFTAESGSYWCIAGPNGSGKSTFLKLACGLLDAAQSQGSLRWDGRPVAEISRLELARNIGFVAGSLRSHFPISVAEFVLQGRYPRSSTLWSQPTATDRAAAEQALEQVGITPLGARLISEISSGELQLAMIARALAQEPRVLILDETTANLDLHYQLRVFDLLAVLNRRGLTIFVVSHDLNLAAEYCPNALWLKDGATHAQGSMRSTLTTELMGALYGVADQVEVATNPFTGQPKVFTKNTGRAGVT